MDAFIMPRRHSALDDLITLPWWLNLILAATVYVFLKYWLPTIEFHSPVFKGLAAAIPNMSGTCEDIGTGAMVSLLPLQTPQCSQLRPPHRMHTIPTTLEADHMQRARGVIQL